MLIFYKLSGVQFNGGFIGPLFVFFIFILIRRIRDSSLQLEEEIKKKDQVASELQKHETHLKEIIDKRTV